MDAKGWRDVDALMERIADATANNCVLGRRPSRAGTAWFAATKAGDDLIEYDGSTPLDAVQSVHARLVEVAKRQVAAHSREADEAREVLEVLGGI